MGDGEVQLEGFSCGRSGHTERPAWCLVLLLTDTMYRISLYVGCGASTMAHGLTLAPAWLVLWGVGLDRGGQLVVDS